MTAVTTAPSTPAADARPEAPARFPLDPLRAVAALSVVMFHVFQYEFGDINVASAQVAPLRFLTVVSSAAVDLFFVISGFLLYLSVARAGFAGRPGRSAGLTLLRRMARLYPLYAAIVLVVWGVSNTRLPGVWQDLVLHLTMTQIYSQEYIFWTNGPAWSLAVEFHFYVLVALTMPLVSAACRRRTDEASRLRVLLVLPGLLLVGGLGWIAWSILVAQTPTTHWPTWFGFPAKAPMFAVGMILAVLTVQGVRLRSRAVRVLSAALGGALLVLALDWGTTGGHEGSAHEWWHLLYAGAAVLLLAPIVLSTGPAPRVLTWRPLVFLGGISYGIYLLHEPLMRLLGHVGLLSPEQPSAVTVLVGWVLVGGAAVVGGWLSQVFLERPAFKLLALRDPDGRPRDYYPHLRPGAGPTVTPLRRGDDERVASVPGG